MKKLIYFWCENLRSFEDTEFNFSSKYKIHFDKNTETLTIDKGNKNYIDNFYGENIELNAIVGNNGAGKSSIFKGIYETFYQIDIFDRCIPKILIFEVMKNNLSELIIFFVNLENYTSIKILKNIEIMIDNFQYIDIQSEIHCLYLTQVLDRELYIRSLQGTKRGNYSTVGIFQTASIEDKIKTNKMVSFFHYQFVHQMSFLSDKIVGKYNSEIIKIPFKVNDFVEVRINDNLYDSLEELFKYNERKAKIFRSIINNLRGRNTKKTIKPIGNMYNKFSEALLMSLIYTVYREEIRNDKFKGDILDFLYKITISNEFRRLNSIDDKIDYIFEQIDGKVSVSVKQYCEVLKIFREIEMKSPEKQKNDCLNIPFFIKNDNGKIYYGIKKFYEKYSELDQKRPFLEFSWGLSSGETAMLDLYSKFYQIRKSIENSKYKNIILLIDEADAYFHPQWQKDYVKDTLYVAKQIFEGFDVQIILSTHSPIMLSDIPKQNVLYLKKGKNGDTKVVPREERQETFGANIFSLFKDTFFLEGSGIGSFAEDKLAELLRVIRSLRENQESNTSPEEILRRIQCIGDPFIRRKFENEFEKYTKSDTRDALKKRRALLENELEQIKRELGEN